MESRERSRRGQTDTNPSPHVFRAIVLTWMLWLGVDFLAHAGLFGSLFEQPSPFLLQAKDLFARIPLAYAAFLSYVGMVVWLVRMLGVTQPSRGAMVGATFGILVTGAGTLAVLSISTIGLLLAAVWTGVQLIEFAAAGYFGTWAAREPNARSVVAVTIAASGTLVALGIAAQNIVA